MPVARESVRVIGPDSIMSSALPAGGPSRISVSTTSASSRSTIRCAVVDPTKPPPTTVTLFLLIRLLVFRWNISARSQRTLRRCLGFFLVFAPQLARDCGSLHVLNDRRREVRGTDFRGTWHEPLEIVGHSFLLNRSCDAVLDQLRCFLPSKKLEHHRTRKHHGAW